MSSDTISLQLDTREVVGKKVKQLRAQNIVPGVIYNRGEAIHVSAPYKSMAHVWQEAGKNHAIEVTVGNEKHLTLIKDVDFEPLRHEIRHVVFSAVRRDEKTEAEVPIVLEGDAPAERVGLMVLKQLDQVEISAFPQDIPEKFVVDATKLAELHDKVLVGDLIIPANVEMITEASIPVAVVEEPRAHAAAEEEVAEPAEGEAAEGDESSDEAKDDKSEDSES